MDCAIHPRDQPSTLVRCFKSPSADEHRADGSELVESFGVVELSCTVLLDLEESARQVIADCVTQNVRWSIFDADILAFL
jgi:hypothetical protein